MPQKPVTSVTVAHRKVTAAVSAYRMRGPGAGIAQLVEQRIRNARVVGSNPIPGTIFYNKNNKLLVARCCGKLFCFAEFGTRIVPNLCQRRGISSPALTLTLDSGTLSISPAQDSPHGRNFYF